MLMIIGDTMKIIQTKSITEWVKQACIEINYKIDPLIKASFELASKTEKSPVGKEILLDLLENSKLAETYVAPICQDTGMVIAFVKIGQDVKIEGGSLTEAIQEGIRLGYSEGYLRKSVVKDPLVRENTGDNTPGIIYYDLVEQDVFEIEIAAKGFGSENMSASKMLKPSDGVQGVIDFVIDTVEKAGSNPCPPNVLGNGIGGTLDKAAQNAKHALMRTLGNPHEAEHIAKLEAMLLEKINQTGVGPQGLGGTTTALAVHIETYPTHIAGLPVVVNINCHASRHKKIVL